ncbi:MAG: tetratricopeptide repeat protein, partial [Armatimonadetes bacterium]|nr:tetratricopeptide repeat protein [Armatimonadota bacterium]NIO75058.1 tetratricopeptide repeat protein [Armatimonadota bacterium]NIO95708.1 tetratricopeptide repeat protein [Armatimonadota bacterium]
FASAYNNLGVVHERRGEPEKAMVAYEKALLLDPDLAEARKNLERIKARR